MTFEAHSAALVADVTTYEDIHVERPAAPRATVPFPANDDVADPQAGWATRNPDRAMLFLFVSPRDCGAVDELMAL